MCVCVCVCVQLTQGDVTVERDTYKQSRQGLDEMYNEAQRQLKEECQLRQVRQPGSKVPGGRYHVLSGCVNVCQCFNDDNTVARVQDVENELVVQVSMKQEMELAMKLLEKDIHEKQVRLGLDRGGCLSRVRFSGPLRLLLPLHITELSQIIFSLSAYKFLGEIFQSNSFWICYFGF